jgi:hypothetical protein
VACVRDPNCIVEKGYLLSQNTLMCGFCSLNTSRKTFTKKDTSVSVSGGENSFDSLLDINTVACIFDLKTVVVQFR